MISESGTEPHPPLRADAERNRQKLLVAARELFASCGLDVTLDDIARHAGVGVGTAYRRFPNKQALIDDLVVDRVHAMADLARSGLELDDPMAGLRHYVDGVMAMHRSDRSIKQVLFSTDRGQERVAAARRTIAPAVGALLDRAKAAGVVRDDVLPSDVALITLMLSQVVDFSREVEPGLYARYADALLRGLTVEAGAPEHPPLDMPRFADAMAAFKFGAAPRPPR